MSPTLRRILQQSSRSFGLSVRLLPRAMRQPVGLAYLCARLSDTVADEGQLPPAQRLKLLQQLQELFQNPHQVEPEKLQPFQQLANSLEHSGERKLLQELGQLLLTLSQESEPIKGCIDEVLQPILSGQSADIQHFELDYQNTKAELKSLRSEEELLHYCWQVAGCVGEFWGKLGRLATPQAFPDEQICPQLSQWGSAYGQALQLINILRDLPQDAQNGRCYLPGDWASAQQAWQQASQAWLLQARSKLQFASEYCAHLNSFRLRLATALPAAIGWKTLALLEAASYQKLAQRLKISRPQVYQLLGQGILASRSPQAIKAWLESLRDDPA